MYSCGSPPQTEVVSVSIVLQNTTADSYGLDIPGVLLAGGYALCTYVRFSEKLQLEEAKKYSGL